MAAAAVVLAAVAFIGVYVYASNADKRAQENAGFVDALVASASIAKGTTGSEVIQAGLVTRERVARGSIPGTIITDPSQLVNKIAAAEIDEKQFITVGTFVSPSEGGGNFASAIAHQNLVAVSVSVDATRGVANQIVPGDHVDIAVQGSAATGPNGGPSYLLQNVKVLAVGTSTVLQAAQDGVSAAPPATNPGLLTFELTPEDALRVIGAAGNIYLVLLPPTQSTASPSSSGSAASSGTGSAAASSSSAASGSR